MASALWQNRPADEARRLVLDHIVVLIDQQLATAQPDEALVEELRHRGHEIATKVFRLDLAASAYAKVFRPRAPRTGYFHEAIGGSRCGGPVTLATDTARYGRCAKCGAFTNDVAKEARNGR
jgi:hypothetical protein